MFISWHLFLLIQKKLVDIDVTKKTLYNELVKRVNATQAIDGGNLVKKVDYNTKIGEIEKKIPDHDHGKYIATQEFNKLTAENLAARLAQAKLAGKVDITYFVKKVLMIN